MAIVGHTPESGVRVVLERPRAGGPPWRYQGEVATPGARFRVAATLDIGGDLTVEIIPDPPAGLTDKVRLMLRAAWRRAREDRTAPPLRLARWRDEGKTPLPAGR
jgi:hypothetical protein